MEATRPLFDQEYIQLVVAKLGEAIRTFVPHPRPLSVVVVLDGAFMFGADLIRTLHPNLSIGFARCKSYTGTKRGRLTVHMDDIPLSMIEGKDVLVIEDIVDSGTTLMAVYKALDNLGARSMISVAMACKPSNIVIDGRAPDWHGITVPGNCFVVGYGMDYDGRYRELPDIRELAGVVVDKEG